MENRTITDLGFAGSYLLKDMLQIASLRDAICLTASDCLARRVRRINVIEASDIAEWSEADEFVLTSGYAFREDPGLLASQIGALKEKGVAGLGIKLTRFNAHIADEIVREAARLSFPIVELPITAVFSNIVQEGMEEILKSRLRDFQDIQTATEVLLTVMSGEQTPEGALGAIEDMFDNPVLVIDEENELMLTPATRALLAGEAEERLIQQIYFRRTDEPLMIRENGAERRIPIYTLCSGERDGMSMFLLEYNDPLTESDRLVLTYVRHSLILEMRNALTIKKIRRKYKTQFVEDLLAGKLGDDPVRIAIDAQTDGYALSADSEYRVVAVNLDLGEESLFSETEVSIIRWIMRNLDANILFKVDKGKLILIEEEVSWDKLVSNFEILAHRLDFVMKKGRVTFCVSDPVPLARITESYEQALKISGIVKKRRVKEQVVTADMLGTSYLLSMLPGEEAGLFTEHVLGRLKAYDRSHNSSLIGTVKAYLDTNGNKQITSERLHIHYNTAVYRLSKAEEILGALLSDTELQFRLRMALKIDEIL